MRIKSRINKLLMWQTISLGLMILLLHQPIETVAVAAGQRIGVVDKQQSLVLVQPAYASDIYPMFTCPCCGNPLDKETPCCGSAEEMIGYIDQQLGEGKSRDEVVLATTREYGLERLTNDADRVQIQEQLVALAPADAAKIAMDQTSQDLGVVSQRKGEVFTDFNLTNEGESDLIINKLSSSCGCTSADVVYEGEEGPRFYMAGHGHDNPTDWQVAIKPGDRAVLRVYYDPNMHKDLVGPVTREVTVYSNDPVNFATKATIKLDQER